MITKMMLKNVVMTDVSFIFCLNRMITKNFSVSSVSSIAKGNREGRFMKKIMGNTSSKKKWQTDIPIPVVANMNNVITKSESKRPINIKRIAILNKMFMRYITDIMATGTSSSEFLGRGIQINKVKVTPDFQGVNVYWIAKGTEEDEQIEKILIKNAGMLRHELSQLRVMGIVPKIYFVKDKEYAKLIEVDIQLSQADFGEDYVPVEPSYKFKSEYSLDIALSPHVKERLQDLESENVEENYIENLPPMRQDVLNLNHAEIMSRIKKSIKKSQAPHRELTPQARPTTINEDPVEYENLKQQREAFTQFLIKRQILQEKAKRDKNQNIPEFEYLHNEANNEVDDSYLKNSFKELDDYIEEMEDENKT